MSSDGLTFYYGDFEHPKGECYPKKVEIRPLQSERGVRWATLYRMEMAGSLVGQTPELTESDVLLRMEEIRDAYTLDYKDFGFKQSDGTDTMHTIETDDPFNLSGVKIVHRSWDSVYPTELANTRSFSVTLQSLFLESYNEILFFQERTQKIGTGGPKWRQYNIWDGVSVREDIHNQTKVRHVTTGTVVGLSTWPLPPEPLWPLEEQEWRRSVTQGSPRFHGDLNFEKGTHYPTGYTYHFERPNADPTTDTNTWYLG